MISACCLCARSGGSSFMLWAAEMIAKALQTAQHLFLYDYARGQN